MLIALVKEDGTERPLHATQIAATDTSITLFNREEMITIIRGADGWNYEGVQYPYIEISIDQGHEEAD